MRRKFIVVLCILIIVGVFFYSNSSYQNIQEDNDTTNLSPKELFFLDSIGLGTITCTGFTYDSINEAYWIADYGYVSPNEKNEPKIIEVSTDFSKIKSIIDLKDLLEEDDNLQGIAFDSKTNSLWIAVGNTIKNVSKQGELLESISVREFEKYKSNGICVDETDDTLWILCYQKYLIHMSREGKIIEKIKFNYQDQDQITIYGDKIYITVGDDYTGDCNYVLIFDKESKEIIRKYKAIESYAVEGILLHNNQIFIANDGYYHNATIKKSYISIYNLPLVK